MLFKTAVSSCSTCAKFSEWVPLFSSLRRLRNSHLASWLGLRERWYIDILTYLLQFAWHYLFLALEYWRPLAWFRNESFLNMLCIAVNSRAPLNRHCSRTFWDPSRICKSNRPTKGFQMATDYWIKHDLDTYIKFYGFAFPVGWKRLGKIYMTMLHIELYYVLPLRFQC